MGRNIISDLFFKTCQLTDGNKNYHDEKTKQQEHHTGNYPGSEEFSHYCDNSAENEDDNNRVCKHL